VSLRTRLILAAAYLLVVVVVALEVPLAVNIERRAVFEFQSQVLGYAGVTASQIADQVGRITAAQTGSRPEPPRDVPLIDHLTKSYGSQTDPASRVVVVDGFGNVISDSAGQAPPGTPYATSERPEFSAAMQSGSPQIGRRYSTTLGQELLVVTVPITEGTRVVGAVRFSAPLGTVMHKVHVAWVALAAIGLAVITAGLALAWFLATSLARPVQRLEETAEQFGGGHLGARASLQGPTEVAALAASFNRMADAVGTSIESQRDFVANASHQLRTPLTGLRLRLEAIEHAGGTSAEEARKALTEVDRLASLVNDLLELTRTSLAPASAATLDLSQSARDAAERWTAPATEAGVTVSLRANPRAHVWADPKDLSHILDNLLENAIRYCPRGSSVWIETSDRPEGPTVSVSDDGPGIPEAERHRVFQRFYRGSSGRSAGTGSGLGLAIVDETTRRWGGTVALATGQDGRGTRFEITFPAMGAQANTHAEPATPAPPDPTIQAPADSATLASTDP